MDNVCLGGTRDKGNHSLEWSEEDSKGIWKRCTELCPSLQVSYNNNRTISNSKYHRKLLNKTNTPKEATVEREWVGLRPHREPIHVEKEIIVNKHSHQVIVITNNNAFIISTRSLEARCCLLFNL